MVDVIDLRASADDRLRREGYTTWQTPDGDIEVWFMWDSESADGTFVGLFRNAQSAYEWLKAAGWPKEPL